MSKICVIISCYYKHNILNNIYSFLINIYDKENFDIYMINNNIENHDNIIKMYCDNFIVFVGENSQYEFSGIQKCLDMLKKTNICNNYNIFILGTDALFNHPVYYFDFINRDMFEYVEKNEICVGNIDSFDKSYEFDNLNLNHWMRSSMIIINAKLFKKINYCFMSYRLNEIYNNNKLKLKIDEELKKFLNNWLDNKRYKYLDTIEKKNIKLSCIYNEWKFTNNIEKYGKIVDFTIAYYLKYVDEIITKNNSSVLLNSTCYIKKEELCDLINKNVDKQILLKKKIIY